MKHHLDELSNKFSSEIKIIYDDYVEKYSEIFDSEEEKVLFSQDLWIAFFCIKTRCPMIQGIFNYEIDEKLKHVAKLNEQ